MEKLLGRFVEVPTPLVRNVKFDGCGTSGFHISDEETTLVILWE
jgi:hypothetical protein